MQEFGIFHWLLVLAIILILMFGKKITEAFHHLGQGPRGDPPTHPVPVTGPIENSRRPKDVRDSEL